MKYTIIIIGLLLFSCNHRDKQNTAQKKENQLKELIVNRNQDSLKIKVCNFFNESSEGGEIRGYYDKDYLSRIEVELYSELGKESKEFTNNKESNSFEFKQRYFYYDKPFYEKDFKVIDSVIITGTYNDEILHKKIIGKRMKEEDLNKILSDINISKNRYTLFLKECPNE